MLKLDQAVDAAPEEVKINLKLREKRQNLSNLQDAIEALQRTFGGSSMVKDMKRLHEERKRIAATRRPTTIGISYDEITSATRIGKKKTLKPERVLNDL